MSKTDKSAKIFEEPLSFSNIKGGDTFVLKPADGETVYNKPTIQGQEMVIETVYDNYWVKDEALSKKGHAEFKKNVQEWYGS